MANARRLEITVLLAALLCATAGCTAWNRADGELIVGQPLHVNKAFLLDEFLASTANIRKILRDQPSDAAKYAASVCLVYELCSRCSGEWTDRGITLSTSAIGPTTPDIERIFGRPFRVDPDGLWYCFRGISGVAGATVEKAIFFAHSSGRVTEIRILGL